MVVIKQFWTPCYWYDDVNKALSTIACYTATLAVVTIAYTCYVLDGGESSQYYMPYFEANRETSLPWAAAFVIIFMVILFASSVSLLYGVRIENRGLIIPWLVSMSVILTYQLYLGLELLYAYYIYLETILVVLVDWLWMAYNIYAWLAIFSIYQEIKMRQTPTFIYIY